MLCPEHIPDRKTFLNSVERYCNNLCNAKPNDTKDKLSEEERSALKNWGKDVLFNKESKLVIRLQGKSNRFVELHKETDKIKAQQQITKSQATTS